MLEIRVTWAAVPDRSPSRRRADTCHARMHHQCGTASLPKPMISMLTDFRDPAAPSMKKMSSAGAFNQNLHLTFITVGDPAVV